MKNLTDYIVLDTETTGLDSTANEIIEIGILKVRNNQIVERFSQLIKPRKAIDANISNITGITNEMVENKPSIDEVKQTVLDFIGSDTIVGHNIQFDIRFICQSFHTTLVNETLDTIQHAREIYTDLPHHNLTYLSNHFHLTNNEHRALADCVTTKELYDTMKEA